MAVVLGAGSTTPEPEEDPAAALGLRGLRPLARASRLACAAAAAALAHPAPPPAPAERCAVVLGTRFASIEPLVEFDRVAAVDGPALVNPSSFPNVVANAHAGYLGILFGLAGPNITLCGADAGLESIALALDLLELGRADVVLAGGVESLGDALATGLRRTGVENAAEGAALVLLGREGSGVALERAGDRLLDLAPRQPVALGRDFGAAGGALAAVLAVDAAGRGAGPQRVGVGPDALLVL